MSFQDIPDDPSLADPLPQAPFDLLVSWIEEAEQRCTTPNPTAITLATVDSQDRPSARMVLCRGIKSDPGYIVVYTNYHSRKGDELGQGAYAAAVFHWDELRRQIRIEGPVVRSPTSESDAYFATRPPPSQIAAWASDQSQPIDSRASLLAKLKQCDQQFAGKSVPRPPHWGGYRLYGERVELWVGADGRAHDRALWTRMLTREGAGFCGGLWEVTRLQP